MNHQKSCFYGCCSLRTGSIAIAVLNLAIASVLLVYWFSSTSLNGEHARNLASHNFGINNLLPIEDIILCLILGKLYFPFCVLLCFGIIKKKPSFMKPWLVINAILIIAYIYIGISWIWMAAKDLDSLTPPSVIVAFFVGLVVLLFSIGLSIYFWRVVCAYLQELRQLHLDSSSGTNKDPNSSSNNVKLKEANEPMIPFSQQC